MGSTSLHVLGFNDLTTLEGEAGLGAPLVPIANTGTEGHLRLTWRLTSPDAEVAYLVGGSRSGQGSPDGCGLGGCYLTWIGTRGGLIVHEAHGGGQVGFGEGDGHGSGATRGDVDDPR